MKVFATIHSEVATVPVSFKSKGIKDMSFKLGLPPDFESKMRFLAGVGFGSTKPIKVNKAEISPRDYFVALSETFPKPTGKPNDFKCLRVDAKGVKDGVTTEISIEMMCYPYEPWNMKTGPYSVGVPVGITARMIGSGVITKRGCIGAEIGVPPEEFFKYCGKRHLHTKVIYKYPVA